MKTTDIIPDIIATQADLARVTGVTPTTVHRWTKSRISEGKAARLARLYPGKLIYDPKDYVKVILR